MLKCQNFSFYAAQEGNSSLPVILDGVLYLYRVQMGFFCKIKISVHVHFLWGVQSLYVLIITKSFSSFSQ